ncbi:polyisoprenoid-binding protein YceI [Breoghania corrubedonensis]|uniref:Polyisoprenoid-binding protein YceI n=1 Tax=Breoghania corrubedonensis TaxID=665038 RepID=A0A2T5UW76_9HYPH|nr:YceI family protein [Breoghania corrubedonensis]PTW55759.1 polyisoprenoid-binding protein YceI [Breoghania corrubedonensis]
MVRLAATALAASLLAAPALAEPVAYTVDKSHSSIFFSVEHLGFSTIHGHFGAYDADIVLDEDDLANSKANVTIDMSSLDTFWEPRTEHLKTADFFDVEKFPQATFVSRTFKKTGENKVAVTGDLSIHGKTKEVTIDFTVKKVGQNPMAKVKAIGLVGTTVLKRSDYNVAGYAPAVADEVPLRIDLELDQKQ